MKKIILLFSIACILLISAGIYLKNTIYSKQITKDTTLYLSHKNTVKEVIDLLEPLVLNINHIKTIIPLKKYKKVKGGKYVLKKGLNTNQLINLLRSGKQTPIKVTFNNQHYIENLAGKLSHQIEADSLSILNALLDESFLNQNNLNPKTALHICMPYTYECYWNISPKQLRTKFFKAYQRFWTAARLEKANRLNLSQSEIISLAAIVQKESQHKAERTRIAGVYLNRIKRGIPLQADPTVIYAAKEKYGRDYEIKRVLNKDLKISSPYNTYQNRGVPPSAIAMPDVDAIEAVLNAEHHDYIFFCANPKQPGTHNFAKTLTQHNRNAKIYQRWLNRKSIMR